MLINKIDIYNSISCLALYRKIIKLNISKNHNNNTEIKQERKESLHALHVEFILLYTYEILKTSSMYNSVECDLHLLNS